MDSISFEIDDLITSLAYDSIMSGRYVDDALTHITGYIDPEEYTDSFEVYMFNNFPHFSKLLDSFNYINLEEETKKPYLDLINQLFEYQENPDDNQNFKDEIYASVLKNPSLAAFAIYNRETEGIIEKEIISRLTSFSEDTSDFKYTVFNRAIKEFISDNSWRDYRNFDWTSFNLMEKLEQMRGYGLLEYEDLFSKEGITVTDLGRSVYDVLDSFYSNGYVFKPLVNLEKRGRLKTKYKDTEVVVKTEDIQPSVDDDTEPLPDSSESDVMHPAVEQLLIEGSKSLGLLPPSAGVSNFLAVSDLLEYEGAESEVGLPDAVKILMHSKLSATPEYWFTEYEGREFPYGIQVNGNLKIALDDGRENVIEVLNHDGRISEEYLSFLCTFFASDYNVIADKVSQDGNGKFFYDAMSSLLDKGLISKDRSGFVPGPNSVCALNYGINSLIAFNPEYTENERKIIKTISSHDDVMDKIEYI